MGEPSGPAFEPQPEVPSFSCRGSCCRRRNSPHRGRSHGSLAPSCDPRESKGTREAPQAPSAKAATGLLGVIAGLDAKNCVKVALFTPSSEIIARIYLRFILAPICCRIAPA